MKNIFLHILRSGYRLEDLVLATVVRTSGSTPQKAGSSALFDRSGLVFGTIGGGILEGKVTEIARKSINSRKSGLYRFSLDNNSPSGEDALCGGSVTVMTDSDLRKHLPVLKELGDSITARIPGVLITMVSNIYDESVKISRFWATSDSKIPVEAKAAKALHPEILSIIDSSDPYDFRELELLLPGDETASLFYMQALFPLPRLIIAGAGHIGKALAILGQMLDFDVTVIDDRRNFANPDNISTADHLMVGDIGKMLSGIEKGRDSYIVIVTRGHRDDANALKACIGSGAAYIGMIGSRNKVAFMRKEFLESKWATPEQWANIFAPVGLEIHSQTVEEIAVSIAAQLVQVRNRNETASGRQKPEAGSNKNSAAKE